LGYSQNDSIVLDVKQLDWTETFKKDSLVDNEVISGLRIPTDINDLPFTIYVVTQDEIILNGYNTLVDVISSLPGIRVSQPGSAEDGETFMMRGFYGNTYAKILINNFPIKPFVLKAFPIGAQLPIKNIERIEVLYGPSASIHGADASVGVINIITKEEIKSHNVTANYTIGDGTYQSLNLEFESNTTLFKQNLGFRIYGSSTQLRNRDLDYTDPENMNPSLYDFRQEGQKEYYERDNYLGTIDVPTIREFPSESQFFGLELELGKLKYSSQLMYRKEHSAIGLNSAAVAYSNPLVFFGEKIYNSHIELNNTYNKLDLKIAASILDYNLDTRTSQVYVSPFELILDGYLAENLFTEVMQKTSFMDSLYDDRYSNIRYGSANSTENNFELSFNYRLNKKLNFLLGSNLQRGSGSPLNRYLNNSVDNEIEDTLVSTSFVTLNLFGQMFFNYEKLKIVLDAHAGGNGKFTNVVNSARVSPRVAVLYKLSNKIRLRSSLSYSIRTPSPYYATNSYSNNTISESEVFSPENTRFVNLGINVNLLEKTIFDADFYYMNTSNLIEYLFDTRTNNSFSGFQGYSNLINTEKRIFGFQAFLRTQDILKSINLNLDASFDLSIGKDVFAVFDPNGQSAQIDELDVIRGYPIFMSKVNFSMNPFSKVYVKIQNTWFGDSVPLSSGSIMRFGKDYRVKGGLRTDLVGRLQLNRNFGVYVKLINVFGSDFGGIDVADSYDALRYNPQEQFTARLGIDYLIK